MCVYDTPYPVCCSVLQCVAVCCSVLCVCKTQPIPLGLTFSNAVSKLKGSNVSVATFYWKETFELWALSFERAFRKWHRKWDWLYKVASEIQHTATHCNTLRHTATHCNTLQHTATHCNTLQRTATHCNTLQHTATHVCKITKRI